MKKYTIIKSVQTVLPDRDSPELNDIMIENSTGIIEKIAPDINLLSENIINDYQGLLAMPGFIDPHVHFRVPGKPESENWTTGSLAAISAGITTVFDMPNTNPPTIDKNGLDVKLKEIEKTSLINYGIFGGLTGNNLEFLIKEKQINAIKVYLASTTGDMLIKDLKNIDLGKSDKVICFHAEDEITIETNMQKYGPLTEPLIHSKIRSEEAALTSVREVINLHRQSGGKFHIAHVSTFDEIAELAGTDISFECAPHHIFCSTENYSDGGYLWKCNPPLRDPSTMKKLTEALHDEKIPMIATDHAPHPIEAKSADNKTPASGIPSLEVGTHMILNELALGRITVSYANKILSENAATRFSVSKRGKLQEGYFADIAIINLNSSWVFSQKNIFSNCGWSPFCNTKLQAKVQATFVNGHHYKTSELVEYKNRQRNHDIYQV